MLKQLLPQVLASLGIDRGKGEQLIGTFERTSAQVRALARALTVEFGAVGAGGRTLHPHNPLDTPRARAGTLSAGETTEIVALEFVGRDYGTVARIHNRDILGAGGSATLIVVGMDEETYELPLDPGAIEDLTGEVWKAIYIKADAGGSSVAYSVKAR